MRPTVVFVVGFLVVMAGSFVIAVSRAQGRQLRIARFWPLVAGFVLLITVLAAAAVPWSTFLVVSAVSGLVLVLWFLMRQSLLAYPSAAAVVRHQLDPLRRQKERTTGAPTPKVDLSRLAFGCTLLVAVAAVVSVGFRLVPELDAGLMLPVLVTLAAAGLGGAIFGLRFVVTGITRAHDHGRTNESSNGKQS